MEIIPAVDLKGGKCVRLFQGEFDREIVYSSKPLEVILSWQERGAPRLHLVDLDGARAGEPVNLELIKRVVTDLQIPVQLGGGIRNLETIALYLNTGIERVILGTAALERPELVREAVERYGPDRIVVGVDARRGKVAVQGWLETSSLQVEDLVREMKKIGIRTFIYTDISRDGMLTGPDLEGLSRLKRIKGIEIIASGGISSLNDLEELRQRGIDKAIIGKAFYNGSLYPDFARFAEM